VPPSASNKKEHGSLAASAMAVPDPYATLEVPKDADIPAIRSAHRKLVLKSHPDRIQDPALKEKAMDTFQTIQQAYELLSDPDRRSRYDNLVKLAELKREVALRNPAHSDRAATGGSRDYLSPYALPLPKYESPPPSNPRDRSPFKQTSPYSRYNVSFPGSQSRQQPPSTQKTRTSISPKELMLDDSEGDESTHTPLFDHDIEKWFDTSNRPTYSCTYHGCSEAFDTPARLQKHKREGHRRINEQLPRYFAKTNPSSDSARHKVLPVSLQENPLDGKGFRFKSFDAVPDTGSDENAMDWETCKLLRLSLNRSRRREFQLANGKPFKSMGQVIVPLAWGTSSYRYSLTFPVVFNVFSRLASPVILGKEFLDETETLTTHQYRLAWREKDDKRQLKIMHLNRPGSRIQCTINGLAALAHADTGAEMNLVRPSFGYKLGRTRGSLTKEDLYVQLADGSCERISSSFECTVGIDGFYGTSCSSTKFYILPGLTSEALLGETTLYEMDVFVKHQSAFVDASDDDEQASLNLIKWLSDRESRVVNSVGGSSTTRSNQTSSPSNLPPASLCEKAFRSALAEADARELHRREQAENRISILADNLKAAARDAERSRAALFDTERARLLALRQQRVNTQ
jgi:curved DNA-binding protein CbpA